MKIARNVRFCFLWAVRGAARNAKMLEAAQAWEVFRKPEDCSFSQKQSITRHFHVIISFLEIDFPALQRPLLIDDF
ncbi:hypothetical protein G9G39_22430 [Cronobacter sp. EKM101R]|nr:hypothetical protein G9G39_22430 [Cronobacter sp. EKM101R]KAF6592399.1 hypothetical protein G9G38_22615 [Cronobacter sp. EKM102R]HDI3034517.1 hypothetical protein [Cronobacter turicensis]